MKKHEKAIPDGNISCDTNSKDTETWYLLYMESLETSKKQEQAFHCATKS